jgi:HK97 family phage prohead protease
MATLNGKGASNARERIGAGDYTSSEGWSFDAADGNAMLGEKGDNWAEYARWHLGVDDGAPADTREHYRYPFGKGGRVYRAALVAIRSRAAQQNDDEVFRVAGGLIEAIDAKEKSLAKAAPPTILRAHSLFEVKQFEEQASGERHFVGIASTPTADRVGDIVEPKGALFKLPISLLWQHDAKQPIGWIDQANIRDDRIEVKGRVVTDRELVQAEAPQSLRDEIARAWAQIKVKLVRGLSIGFRDIESQELRGGSNPYARRFMKWEWLELSAVSIPANMEASIHTVKWLDDEVLQRAASGAPQPQRIVEALAKSQVTPPGVTGTKHVFYLSRSGQ